MSVLTSCVNIEVCLAIGHDSSLFNAGSAGGDFCRIAGCSLDADLERTLRDFASGKTDDDTILTGHCWYVDTVICQVAVIVEDHFTLHIENTKLHIMAASGNASVTREGNRCTCILQSLQPLALATGELPSRHQYYYKTQNAFETDVLHMSNSGVTSITILSTASFSLSLQRANGIKNESTCSKYSRAHEEVPWMIRCL